MQTFQIVFIENEPILQFISKIIQVQIIVLIVWVEILLSFSAEQIKTPKFDGTGYLSFTMPETKSIRHITSFSLEMKTTSIDGMILWIGQDLSSDDYLGVGIRKGMVHLVWNLGWFSRTELTIPSPTVKINDGDWHSIKIHRVRQSIGDSNF